MARRVEARIAGTGAALPAGRTGPGRDEEDAPASPFAPHLVRALAATGDSTERPISEERVRPIEGPTDDPTPGTKADAAPRSSSLELDPHHDHRLPTATPARADVAGIDARRRAALSYGKAHR